MSSRVARLDLVLAIDPEAMPRSEALRRDVERRVLPQILEHCEAEVHQRFGPTAILGLRQLTVTWALEESELSERTHLASLGQALAEELMEQVHRQSEPHRQAAVVLFRSETHRRAVLLKERVESGGADAWYHPHQPKEPFREWLPEGARAVRELLTELKVLRVSGPVARSLSQQTLRELAELVPPSEWPTDFLAALPVQALQPGESGNLPPASRDWLEMMIEAGGHSGPTQAVDLAEEERGGLESGLAQAAMDSGPEPNSSVQEVSAGPSKASTLQAEASLPASGSSRQSKHLAHAQRDNLPLPEPSQAPPAIRMGAAESPDPQGPQSLGMAMLGTRFAGLFYLVQLIQRLELAEALWQVGAREGLVLAHTAALLIGEGEAPVLSVFGGQRLGEPLPPCPALEDWALEELGTQLARSVGVALRPLAQDWGAKSKGAPPIQRLLGLCAGALSYHFRSRMDLDARVPELPWLVQRGRLMLPEERLIVAMPMSAVDLDLRRAGLDQNPGWVPWLKRRVELVFEGGEDPW